MTDTTEDMKISRHLLYEQVAEKLKTLIKEKHLEGGYLPAERDLARLFGVSQYTVRRGLKLLVGQGVIVREHGRGTRILRGVPGATTGSTVKILVVSHAKPSGYLGEMIAGMGDELSRTGWNLVFHKLEAGSPGSALSARISEQEISGLLLMALAEREKVEQILRVWKGPTVLLDHQFDELPLTSVRDDSRGGARQATEHLIALGHRRIGYINTVDPADNPWRREGYLSALNSAGIEADSSLIVGSPADREEGRKAAEKLLDLPVPPTAVFAFDDSRATGVWDAAEARGLEVGRDLALVGCGNLRGRFGRAGLSSVSADEAEAGRAAMRELESMIREEGTSRQTVLIPTRLIVRGSSRDARTGGQAGQRRKHEQ
jgi:LacI family transcriptional regulator, galactose operon repressor